jgi:glycosyltransferase involved in cell wall biosynthesis
MAEAAKGDSSERRDFMKLLLIVPSRDRGGAEHYSLKIARGALERGWEVHAAVPRTRGTGSIIEELDAKGVVHHSFNIPEKHFLRLEEESEVLRVEARITDGMLPRLLHRVDRYLHRTMEAKDVLHQFSRTVALLVKNRMDVVLVSLPWPTFGLGILLACGFLRIPTAVVFHSHPFPFWLKGLKVKAYSWARSRRQRWITVSESSRRMMCGTFQLDPNEVLRIYNGVDASSESNGALPGKNDALRIQVRRELGVPESSLLLLTVARLQSGKGYDYLIPTIPHIVREFPDVRFVWVGGGKQEDLLLQRTKDYGVAERVLMLGYRSDVARLMRSADLLVFPTYYEGHPLTLLEAMGNGLPIVTADAGGIPEVIQHNEHGVLCRSGDSCDLLEAIRWALRHPDQMQEMAGKAKRRVLEFSEGQMVEQTLEVVRELARPGDGQAK